MIKAMPPKRVTKPNKRLIKLRESLGMSQTAFAEKYFQSPLRTYQQWETKTHDELPGPVRVIIESLEQGGRLPA